ncbi:DUF4760 domain-containing protein [Rahnella sp. Lac-M11]|jgi:hypothetical protein|uniref:DUF4760 domain-containing protein n=1 Tax=Rahnella contaminans TaxID=2703882 RepID=A0A6M2B0E2_9GAMM|nr:MULTISPECIES: DUF4760 domain-containing protein [Rahnella]MBU9821935.1 DUF4760 domain-containing protein [Rahnella sp. BCC 1045]MDF1896837.1 DUF4760 domain-containing protein [Rahnella contaminans]NGX86535.1 DUF4760 domain-containing protein [Rahnella contaminans]
MGLDALRLQLLSNIILLIGVIVAISTIIYNVSIARKTQTAVFLFESRSDARYVHSLHVLKKAHLSGKSFRSFVFAVGSSTVTDEEIRERSKFQYILNFYERVAVTIRSGIYDEEMIKRTSYSTVIDTWDIAEPLIKALREDVKSTTTYQEFEWLAGRWKKRPLNSKRRWFIY